MGQTWACTAEQRKTLVRTSGSLNGIDYLEVLDRQLNSFVPSGGSPGDLRQRVLIVYTLNNLGIPNLTAAHINISGGARVKGIEVIAVGSLATGAPPWPGQKLDTTLQAYIPVAAQERAVMLLVSGPGDYSTYRLSLTEPGDAAAVPSPFDQRLSSVSFSFKVECEPDGDSAELIPEGRATGRAPSIDYLGRDFSGLRQTMLDRLAVTLPDWGEPHPADPYLTLVEAIAYMGDRISYYQDAVATEAYLGTARRRTSVRRHARLLDYRMHEGASSRVYATFTAEATSILTGPSPLGPDGVEGAIPVQLITTLEGTDLEVASTDMDDASWRQVETFEPLHSLTLDPLLNNLSFYTWQGESCALPAGATSATLINPDPENAPVLKVGGLLLLEQVRGPTSGLVADADPNLRHVVRLTSVSSTTDALTGQDLFELTWDAEDALPFTLPLSDAVPVTGGSAVAVAQARGNVMALEHGRTVSETLPLVGDQSYTPTLTMGPLGVSGHLRDAAGVPVTYDNEAPAASSLTPPVGLGLAAIRLIDGDDETWLPVFDLLAAGPYDQVFVVEWDEAGLATLRFGDGRFGQRPRVGQTFTAYYRVGRGASGLVGRGSLTRLITNSGSALDGIVSGVTNLLPALGGIAPESKEDVRLKAPQSFQRQERAITVGDWGALAMGLPEVSRARAELHQTGNWVTVFLYLDRVGEVEVDAAFKAYVAGVLAPYRPMGTALRVVGPNYAPLDIALKICVATGHLRATVRRLLRIAFTSGHTPEGQLGFFHPDRLDFGQSIYLSAIVARAMAVAGVAEVRVTKFQRFGQPAQGEITAGRIETAELEIPRVDSDPSFPERGRITFELHGGR